VVQHRADTLEHDQFDMATTSFRVRLRRWQWRHSGREEPKEADGKGREKRQGSKVPNPWPTHG
jgi:hypothetical protein